MKNQLFFWVITLVCLVYGMESFCITVNDLTLDQKIGQLFMVAAVADEECAHEILVQKSYRMDKEYITQLINDYHIGGLIYLGKSDFNKQKVRTLYFQKISEIPLLIGQDLEPGRIGFSRLEVMRNFPSNKILASFNNEKLIYHAGLSIGNICKELGVHINCAPVADVNNNFNNPVINDRAFSDDPHVVARYAIQFANGLSDAGVASCAKHFPGHGDTDVDSHYDLPRISHDKERLYAVELYPFIELIKNGIPLIMVAHLEVPAFEEQKNLPSSLSKNIVTELLRKGLGYTGVIITDSLHMYGVSKEFKLGEYELRALCAGNDIILCPLDVPAAVAAIKQAIRDGVITEQEIDEHVERILCLKKTVKLI